MFTKKRVNYGTFFYKRSSDSNSSDDPKVHLSYESTVPILYIYKTLESLRSVGYNNLIVTYTPTTIIYDPVYENNNKGEKRFKELATYKYYNGVSVVWLYDKLTHNIFAAKFLDTLDPKVHKRKAFHFEIFPLASIEYSKQQGSNLLLDSSNKLAEITFNKKNVSTSVSSLVMKGDFATRTSLNVRVEITAKLKPATDMAINNFLKLSVSDIDLTKTAFYLNTVFQYSFLQDSTTTTELSSDMDFIYLPLDL